MSEQRLIEDEPAQLRGSGPAKFEPAWTKFLTVPGLILTTVVSTTLFAMRGKAHTGTLYSFVTGNRAVTQFIVHVFSSALGVVHVFTLCTLINFATRIYFNKHPVPLDVVKWWNAVCAVRIDSTLPMHLLLLLSSFVVAMVIPPAVWTGALTPIPVSTVRSSTVTVPLFSLSSSASWNFTDWRVERNKTDFAKGTFSYTPQYTIGGQILDSASSATSRDSRIPQSHAKNDGSHFSYFGRSFGVGSSIGLVNDALESSNATISYEYSETGYLASANCIVNSTSQWHFEREYQNISNTYPSMFLATGRLPLQGPENPEHYAVVGYNETQLLALAANQVDRRNFVAIAAGDAYRQLDKIQCEVVFKPTQFSISVDAVKRNITVTPSSHSSTDIEPTGQFQALVIHGVNSISMIYTTVYTSVLGNMFSSNIANVQAQNLKVSEQDITLTAVTDSLHSMIDDFLLAFSSAQIIIAKDKKLTNAIATVRAMQIGQYRFIYAIVVLNTIVVSLFIAEMIRTRVWTGLPRFNYTDVKSVIIGTSMGGTEISKVAHSTHMRRGTLWVGNSSDEAVGGIPAVLRNDEKQLALTFGNMHDIPKGREQLGEYAALKDVKLVH